MEEYICSDRDKTLPCSWPRIGALHVSNTAIPVLNFWWICSSPPPTSTVRRTQPSATMQCHGLWSSGHQSRCNRASKQASQQQQQHSPRWQVGRPGKIWRCRETRRVGRRHPSFHQAAAVWFDQPNWSWIRRWSVCDLDSFFWPNSWSLD